MPHEAIIPTDAPPKPSPDRRQVTHWPGCYRDPAHHACALAEIERLKAEQRWTMAQWNETWAATETNFSNGVEIPADL